jgi:BMFP domain-containing protein YqiC
MAGYIGISKEEYDLFRSGVLRLEQKYDDLKVKFTNLEQISEKQSKNLALALLEKNTLAGILKARGPWIPDADQFKNMKEELAHTREQKEALQTKLLEVKNSAIVFFRAVGLL